jgi:hypothetical protein
MEGQNALAIEIQFHPLPWYCDQHTKSVFHPHNKIKMNNLVLSIGAWSLLFARMKPSGIGSLGINWVCKLGRFV